MNKQFLENVVLKIRVETQSSFQRMGVEGLAVRIENEKDEAFWRPLIESVLPHKLLIFYPYFSEVSTTKGKPDMKKYMDFGDEKLIFCIDADYDYLLENPILNKPFVFHTYVYSLENYWSCAEGLRKVLEKTLNVVAKNEATEGVDFDFEDFFKTYSVIIYDWLTYSIYSTKIKDGLLPAENCGIASGFEAIKDISTDLEGLKNQLVHHTQVLNINYQTLSDFQNFKKRIAELGLNQDNAYLFLRGHDLFDRVTIKLMKTINYLIAKRIFEAFKMKGDKKSAKAFDESFKLINYGEHLQRNNMSYKNTIFFERIMTDFKNAFKENDPLSIGNVLP